MRTLFRLFVSLALPLLLAFFAWDVFVHWMTRP